MEQFISDYWPIVIAAVPVLFKVLNKITPKWYDQIGNVKRFALLLVDLLDMLKVEKKPEAK
jgi:hypothetical protein